MQRNTQNNNNQQSETGSELVFVIETCQNCKSHTWNTRHDEAKYLEYFNKVTQAIVERIPHARTMRNQIPKQYLPFDLYCNLIPNSDPNYPIFMQVPRTGSFEVSYKGLLIFSKLQGGYWPNVELVASKCASIIEADKYGDDVTPYLASGTSGKKRQSSPSKQGTAKKSTNKDVTPAKATFSPTAPIVQQEEETPVKPFKLDESQKFLEQVVPEKHHTVEEHHSQVNNTDHQDEHQDDKHEHDSEVQKRSTAIIEKPEPDNEEQVPETWCGRHLKTKDDLVSYPKFKDGEKGSLLCKFLTEDVWNQLHNKTDSEGFGFKQCIISGCQNTDSGVGVYAISPDSYNTFAPLFTPVIEEYHKIKIDAGHVSNMDHTQLNCPPFSEEDAKMIKSTRIRVGRNLADFPLGPGLTREQRNEIEKLVTEALSKFEGDLKGTYYSLTSMTPQQQKQLIEDHFLFKEGDRFLEAVGLNRNWPEGRGIFHNDAKTFLTWVNEEDQLRIISMEQGSDIGGVFSRLARAANAIEQVAKFAHTHNLGYITSCPTNLGTALRASVHIHLPYLGQNKAEFKKIADKYHVQIRGAHGEHTETDDHIYDISNKRRLGRSEKDLVQDMYDGVSAMIAKEKELRPKVEQVVEKVKKEKEACNCGPHLKKPEDINGFPVFPAGTKSLLSKHLTKDVWKQLKNTKDSAGVSFKLAILSGCQNTDSGIGCYAGSHQSYEAFAPLFDQVIQTYHGHSKTDKHISDMDYKKLVCPPFDEEDAKMIKSTRIRIGRNLAKFPLGPGISREQRNQVEEDAQKAFAAFTGELEGKYYKLGELSEEDRNQLVADHFLFKQGDRFLESCGLNREWPEGRGIFHNNSKTFLVWVNEEDQFRIISMQQGADILAVFKRLSVAATIISDVADFAHDEHLGYITSCPTNLGTALRASVHIHLPLLGNHKEQFQAIADKYNVQIRGAHGEHTETDDHIYDISNRRRLGRSEAALVQDMYDGVKAMIEAEKALRPKPAHEEAKEHEEATPAKTQEDQEAGQAKVIQNEGILIVNLIEAQLTRDTEWVGKMDPYCKMQSREQEWTSTVAQDMGKLPKWTGQNFVIQVHNLEDKLKYQMFEEDIDKDDVIGEGVTKIQALVADGGIDEWFTIQFEGKDAGKIHLRCEWTPKN